MVGCAEGWRPARTARIPPETAHRATIALLWMPNAPASMKSHIAASARRCDLGRTHPTSVKVSEVSQTRVAKSFLTEPESAFLGQPDAALLVQ